MAPGRPRRVPRQARLLPSLNQTLAVGLANLYLSRFEVPQIHLFNVLGRAVPFVGLATRISNDAIMQALAAQLRPTLIDVGIGTGCQACLLLDSLAQPGRLPRRLTVMISGVLLCTIVGGSIGRLCVVPNGVPAAFTTKHIQAMTMNSKVSDPGLSSLMLNFHRRCR